MNWRFGLALVVFACGCGEDTPSDPITESVAAPAPNDINEHMERNEPRGPDNRTTEDSRATEDSWAPPESEAVDVTADDGSNVSVRYPEGADETIVPRPRRRMNVDQLRKSMEQVSGGISWTERSGRNEVNLFESLSSTLGKPDFAQITDEELEPTVLFQKFLGDAARSVCFKMLDADLNADALVASGEQSDWTPALLVHVPADESAVVDQEDVTANIQWLVQRFHGRRLAEDAAGLSEWIWLHQTGRFVSGSSHQAWVAVCVGLFTHPDFYMY